MGHGWAPLDFGVFPDCRCFRSMLHDFAFCCGRVWTFLSVIVGLHHCAVNKASADSVACRISNNILPRL